MEIKRKDILSLGLLFCFLFCSEKVSAAEKLSFNFSGKAHIIFSEPTPEELKNSNITITSNLYGDNTQLVPNNYWITKRVDNDRYDICYKDWNSFFLRIDKVLADSCGRSEPGRKRIKPGSHDSGGHRNSRSHGWHGRCS